MTGEGKPGHMSLSPPPGDESVSVKFEAAVARAVETQRIAGAVAITVNREGETYAHAAGRRAVDADAPMDADTIVWLASMTKAVTSVAALQQVEQGRLSLDGDLSGLIPEFRDLKVLDGFGADGAPQFRPAQRAITLRQLLSHTSGFGYAFTSPELGRYGDTLDRPLLDGSRACHVQPLLFDPGEGWLYGIGIDWAGLAIEAATGRRLDAVVVETLLGPLGMNETAFSVPETLAHRRAAIHARLPEGGLTVFPFELPPEPEVIGGGGGLYGTVRDYGRFVRMLLGGGVLEGTRVISPETAALMGMVETGPRRAGYIKSAMPFMSHDFEPYPDMRTGHGMISMITPEPTPEGRRPGTLAWAGLANTSWWADPEAGVGGVLATQLMPFADPEVLALLGLLERSAYGT
jgi:CubicO group peptidase (beta-lactamase class C family)